MVKPWNKFASTGGQSLLKKDGPKSDLFNDRDDDDSSSLSERDAKKTAGKRRWVVGGRLLRRAKTPGEEDGYGVLFLCYLSK